MALLDFMRRKNPLPENLDWLGERDVPKGGTAKDWAKHRAEIRTDSAMAKVRDETGREPECMPVKVTKEDVAKPRHTRVRIRERDIPY